jgi:uncharacterized protein YjbI with pentapeptide repeats
MLSEGPLVRAWRSKTADSREVALLVFRTEVTESERERFVAAAERIRDLGVAIPGVLGVLAATPSGDAVLTELWTIGSSKEIAGLAWPARRRLDFVRRAALALDSLHRAGIVHGCLCVENVLLGDGLEPILAEAGSVSVRVLLEHQRDAASYVAFAAPEVLEGAQPDVRSDIFSMGRLLQHVLAGDDVPAVAQVVRGCLAPVAYGRPASASELASALAAAIDSLPAVESSVHTAASMPQASPADAARVAPAFERPSDSRFVAPRWLTAAGIALMALAVLPAFTLGGANATVRATLTACLLAGAAVASIGLRQARPTSLVLRISFALACGGLLVAFDPLEMGYRFAAARAIHGNPATRRAAVEQIIRLGRDFRGLSLAKSELPDLDLRGADLRGVDLSDADLSRTNLWGAMLGGATFSGANLSDADLQGTDFGDARSVDLAHCSAGTHLPKPWQCDPAGSPKTAHPSNASGGRPSLEPPPSTR